MATYDYVLYDTVEFGTTAQDRHTLFQVGEGTDSSHGEEVTNMRGSGSLPADEQFVIKTLGFYVEGDTALTDIQKIYEKSLIEVRISDRTVFKAPLKLAAKQDAWGGQYSQATAADEAYLGAVGTGYKLETPIVIPPGTKFSVRIYQHDALSQATNGKVLLIGQLSSGK